VTTAIPTLESADVTLRHGAANWLRSFRLMLRLEYIGTRQFAAVIVVVQFMMGAGMAVMYGFFYPEITPTTALYITTGIPVLALIPMGFVIVPGGIGEQRTSGSFDFIWSLPVPRSAQVTAMFVMYTSLALPGTVLALLVAMWRYGVTLSISPLIVPAVLLAAVMSVAVGAGMAMAITNPMITNLISNALIFVVMLFTPIVYPASNLPLWLMRVHEVLPFHHMTVAIRSGLTDGLVTGTTTSFLVLGAWTVAGTAVTAWVIRRRA